MRYRRVWPIVGILIYFLATSSSVMMSQTTDARCLTLSEIRNRVIASDSSLAAESAKLRFEHLDGCRYRVLHDDQAEGAIFTVREIGDFRRDASEIPMVLDTAKRAVRAGADGCWMPESVRDNAIGDYPQEREAATYKAERLSNCQFRVSYEATLSHGAKGRVDYVAEFVGGKAKRWIKVYAAVGEMPKECADDMNKCDVTADGELVPKEDNADAKAGRPTNGATTVPLPASTSNQRHVGGIATPVLVGGLLVTVVLLLATILIDERGMGIRMLLGGLAVLAGAFTAWSYVRAVSGISNSGPSVGLAGASSSGSPKASEPTATPSGLRPWDGTFNAFTAKNAVSLRVLNGLVKFSVEDPLAASGRIETLLNCVGRLDAPKGEDTFEVTVHTECSVGTARLNLRLAYEASSDLWLVTQHDRQVITLLRTARVPSME